MTITEYLGLQFFEGAYLVVLAFLPFVVIQKSVGIFLVATAILYGLLTVIKRARAKKIDITGQGVLITGCDTGFGNFLAKRLDSIGLTVYAGCLDENGDGANTLKDSKTGRMHVFPLDVTSDESVDNCLDEVTKLCEGKGLWALVNNAGIACLGHVELLTMQMYKRTAEINQFGMVRVTKAFLPLVRRQKGRVLNVTSVRGRIAVPFSAAYDMTKFAVEAFSDVLRLEMQKFGVKVVVIEPGAFARATSIYSDAIMETIERDNEIMWAEASQETKDIYGRDSLDQIKTDTENGKNDSNPTVTPVIDAMEDAIVGISPQYRYLIHGSRKFVDIYCVLAWLNPYLPESWMDFLVNKYF